MEYLRKKIIESAHRHFNSMGIKHLDLDLVVKECMVSRKTMSSQFDRAQLEEIVYSGLTHYTEALRSIAMQQLEP